MSKRNKSSASALLILAIIALPFYIFPTAAIFIKPSLLQHLPNVTLLTIAAWTITGIICLFNLKKTKMSAWLKDAVTLSVIQLLFLFMVSGATDVSVLGNQALSLDYLLISLFMAIYSAVTIYFHHQLKLPALIFLATKAKHASHKNTVAQRIFAFMLVGNNMMGIYILTAISISYLLQKIFSLLGKPLLLASNAGLVILLLLFFATMQPLQSPKVQKFLRRISLRNYQNILIISASVIILFSIINFLLILISQIFTISLLEANPLAKQQSINFFSLGIILTPFITSLFVKLSRSKNTFSQMIFVPLLPLAFYLFATLKHESINASNHSIMTTVTIILSLLFLVVFLNGKRTGDFICGALPFHASKEVQDTRSWRMIPGHLLTLYGFSILATAFPEKLTSIIFTFAAMLLVLSGISGVTLLIRLLCKKPI
jgi:hypothetical protein